MLVRAKTHDGMDEQTPRTLRERTGRHFCIQCLAVTAPEEFFANDHLCDACAAEDQAFPLQTTPNEPKKDER